MRRSPVHLEIVTLGRLAVPVILTQVALNLMGTVDAIMVSGLGTEALAATALGNVWAYGTLLPAMGVLFGLDPIVTQAHGAGDHARVGRALQNGMAVALLLTVPIAGLWLLTAPVLRLMGQDASLAAVAQDFVLAQLFSIPFFLGFFALRQYLSGRGIVAPALWVAGFANVVNLVLNWALIYGHLGLEPRGVVGAGLATGISRLLMCVGLFALLPSLGLHDLALSAWDRSAVAWRELKELLAHGLASGAAFGAEVWGFQVMALLAGLLGAETLAAHSIVLNLASLTFMMPLGISVAAATRVGNLIGAGDLIGSRRAAWIAIAMGAGVMAFSAATFVLLRWTLPAIWRPEPSVLALAAAIMPIAGAFQVFDGTQVVGCGVLRGRGDTKPAAFFNLVGYYVLGIPLGWFAAFRLGWGLPGLWWGLTAGLMTVAVLLLLRVRRRPFKSAAAAA